jgi:hypothetical protein
MAAAPGLRGAISRCESCGLGVVGELGGSAEALQLLDALRRDGTLAIINWGSFAAAFGGGGWAGLQPQARFLFTLESVRRLVATRDQVVRRARWAPARGLALTWQTLINSVTFGRNDAFGALGWGEASRAAKTWQRRIDALISVTLALPALLIALPIEIAGAPIDRGAALSVQIEHL